MTLVSPSQSSAGEEINALDINGPINQLASTINGNLDDSNISSLSGSKLANATVDTAQLKDGSVTNAKLSSTAGEAGGAGASWTPTWTNLTVGNGTVTARYVKVGKLVHFNLVFTLGTTSSITGAFPSFSLPTTAATTPADTGMVNFVLNDVGIANYHSMQIISSAATSVAIVATVTSGAYATESGVTSTIPFTWGSGDSIKVHGWYESV